MKTKLKSITILKKDWKPSLKYEAPCGCLLYRAARRVLGRSRTIRVFFGEIAIGPIFRAKTLGYSQRKYEEKLRQAHSNPKLLPMTIELR